MSYGRPPPRIDGMVSLKVDNLTYRTTPEDLRRVFERCGDVGDIYIPRDRYTRESRGFAFVRFYDRRDAEEALESLDGRMLDGRELRVQMARYGRPSSPYRSRYERRRSHSRSRSRSRRRSRSRSRSRRRSYTRSRSRSRSRSDSKSSRGRSRSHSRSRSRSRH
ncbi:SR family splicing factor SC35 isoform 1-T1 [Aphomia sociella]